MLACALVVLPALVALLAISATRPGATSGTSGAGEPITPVRLKTASGSPISLPQPGRPGVLLFAASTCASCIRAAKALSAVKARLGGRFDALMIDVDSRDTPADLSAWTGVVGRTSYPLAIDTTGRLAAAYAIEGLGATIVYNAHGRLVARLANPGVTQLEHALHDAGVPN